MEYPAHMTESEVGKRIYLAWQKTENIGRVHEWDDYEAFFAWSIDHGATKDKRLVRKDITQIWSPWNCVWQEACHYSKPVHGLHEFTPENWDMITKQLREELM